MPSATDSIRAYDDENTNLFLNFSGHKQAQNIHRSLWMRETKTLEDALIQAEIESAAPPNARIADLGGGVGSWALIGRRVRPTSASKNGWTPSSKAGTPPACRR